jgi:hypothetical protein
VSKTVTLELPEFLAKHWKSDEELTQEMKEAFVLDSIRKQRITWRQGAQFLNKSYKGFLHFMFENNVPVLDCTLEELDDDLETLKRLRERAR